ncbi:hypothetical protein M885DRAFT_533987 [Pelagophyceae sp. CCMP2097]|nr:hypothetical protein M885DRAFT_533987 [Pelagophyceae sp. CCMP2097]
MLTFSRPSNEFLETLSSSTWAATPSRAPAPLPPPKRLEGLWRTPPAAVGPAWRAPSKVKHDREVRRARDARRRCRVVSQASVDALTARVGALRAATAAPGDAAIHAVVDAWYGSLMELQSLEDDDRRRRHAADDAEKQRRRKAADEKHEKQRRPRAAAAAPPRRTKPDRAEAELEEEAEAPAAAAPPRQTRPDCAEAAAPAAAAVPRQTRPDCTEAEAPAAPSPSRAAPTAPRPEEAAAPPEEAALPFEEAAPPFEFAAPLEAAGPAEGRGGGSIRDQPSAVLDE